MSSKTGGRALKVGARTAAGAGGGTSDNFGSFGFLPFGLRTGLGVAAGRAPFGAKLLPPIFNLILGTVGIAAGVEAAGGALDALDIAGIWGEGVEDAGGRAGGCACSFLLAASSVLLMRTQAAAQV